MTKEEYFNLCKNHDWLFYFSDDYNVYRKGESIQQKLMALAKENSELDTIYQAWYSWHRSVVANAPVPCPSLKDFVKC